MTKLGVCKVFEIVLGWMGGRLGISPLHAVSHAAAMRRRERREQVVDLRAWQVVKEILEEVRDIPQENISERNGANPSCPCYCSVVFSKSQTQTQTRRWTVAGEPV